MDITVAILIDDSFVVEELLEVRMILDEEGIGYDLFSTAGGEKTGDDGTTILTSALNTPDLMNEEYQGLFLIESSSHATYDSALQERLIGCIREMYQKGRLIVSIGEALSLVHHAGILIQKKVTGPEHFRTEVGDGIDYVSERVVVDETLLSARGPSDAYHITHTACDLLHAQYK